MERGDDGRAGRRWLDRAEGVHRLPKAPLLRRNRRHENGPGIACLLFTGERGGGQQKAQNQRERKEFHDEDAPAGAGSGSTAGIPVPVTVASATCCSRIDCSIDTTSCSRVSAATIRST